MGLFLGTSIQSVGIGFLTPKDHVAQVAGNCAVFFSFHDLGRTELVLVAAFLIPSAVIGMILALDHLA